MRALLTAATGMEAQQRRIDVIANNIANVATTGFKKSRAEFQDLFYETLRAPGSEASDGTELPTGVQIGHGVQLVSVGKVFSPGDRIATGNPLDLSVAGRGWFQVLRPDGEIQYTRDGTFHLNADGVVVTSQGYELVPTITIPDDSTNITVMADGTVTVQQPGALAATNLGQIELARFTNPSGLESMGGNLQRENDGSGVPVLGVPDEDGFGSITSGFLEGSNVNVAEELVQMILAQRAFEISSRVISAGDEMLRNAATLGR